MMPPAVAPAVALANVCKRYAHAAAPALDHLSLEAREGEFLFLLGPSGSGKTTALRLIGGYEHPNSGEVRLGGALVNAVPAHKRNVGMVFQHYALFPHLSVGQNVAFGLRMRGAARREQQAAVEWALDLVRLPGLAGRTPCELSGGQQQRVALARALAFRPRLLLLDEPLANLDRHLRDEMRLELKALQRRLGVTTIFVTHDQEEALALADRVAVLDGGRLEEAGTPAQLYNHPRSAFVARFMGEATLLPAHLGALLPDGTRLAAVAGAPLAVRPPDGATQGDTVTVCLRAERFILTNPDEAPTTPTTPTTPATGVGWPGTVQLVTYLGARALVLVSLDTGPTLRVLKPCTGTAVPWEAGDRVAVRWGAAPPHCLRGTV